MIGDIVEKYCPICQKIGDELFHLDVSVSESMKKLSNGFREFVLEEQGGIMDGDSPEEYAQTVGGGLNLEEMFSTRVRSFDQDK